MLLKFLLILYLSNTITGKPFVNTCGYDSCPQADPNSLNIHIVPHSHDDVGWQKTVDQYYFEDVQNVLNSVIPALRQNPDRRFIQVETAFFKKWWIQQKDSTKQDVINLVNNGQFEIINGGWSMNDEAAVHYQYTIDQYTLGLRYLEDTLGECSRPKVGWQIDPFGHSREQASINAQMGFDSLFFARLDYRDKNNRIETKTMDLLWRGSSNLGNSSDIFTSVLYNHYSAPPGFCFDYVCDDEPIIDDEESPDYNYQRRVEEFADYIREQASHFVTNNLIVVMGDDFRYQAALMSYINTDRLIDGLNNKFPQTYEDRPIKAFYSTPSCYAKAVNDFAWDNNFDMQIKTDDFFPYGDGVASMVVGYFTSRPASKRFVREGNNVLQVAKQLAASTRDSYDNEKINYLKEAMGIMQHHDAITGTEYQEVTDDYHRMLHKGIADATESISLTLSNLISGDESDFEFKSCLMANVSSCDQSQGDTFIVAVYNPLSRTVTSLVSLPVSGESWLIIDPQGNETPYQISEPITDFSYVDDVPISQYILDFTAKDIPALGYRVYQFEKSSKQEVPPQEPRLNVGFDDTNFDIDETTGLITSVTMNNLTLEISQDFFYYTSGGSAAWVFKPSDETAQRVAKGKVDTTPISGEIYRGLRQDFGDFAKQIIKIYNDDRGFIEFDWIIGPLDISDGGKEVVSRFSTYLKSDRTFYTDSNGRELLKRVRNYRPDFEYTDEQPTAGNYYPVTSKIVIRDEGSDVELAVLTDRSEGGGSLVDGEVELMVHRACSDDAFGLNEQQYGRGIMIRGKHWLVLGKTDGDGQRSLAAIERDVALRKFLPPWTLVSNKDVSSGSLKNLEGSLVTRDLPENVQILTLEPWMDGVLLVRLEHLLEANEDDNLSQEVTVDLTDLFTSFKIVELKETTLAANINIEDNVRLGWPGSDGTKLKESNTKALDGLNVTLKPMQIRTFLATLE